MVFLSLTGVYFFIYLVYVNIVAVIKAGCSSLPGLFVEDRLLLVQVLYLQVHSNSPNEGVLSWNAMTYIVAQQ